MTKVKKYSQEFKEEAVKLVTEQGYSYSQAARDIGISNVTMREWVLKLKSNPENPAKPDLFPAAIELAKLRKEMKILKEEHEILKKAAAFFAKESL